MSEINLDDITKEMFEAFVTVQQSGITNMADKQAVAKYALELADTELTVEQAEFIVFNYSALRAGFAEPTDED